MLIVDTVPGVVPGILAPRSSLQCLFAAMWMADAHRDDGKRFVVRADEMLLFDVSGESHLVAHRITPGCWPFNHFLTSPERKNM